MSVLTQHMYKAPAVLTEVTPDAPLLPPGLEAIVMSPYARGGVTGVGVITALAGFAELGSVFLARGRRPDPGPEQAP